MLTRQIDPSDVKQRWPLSLRSAAGSGRPSRWGSPSRSCPSSLPGGKTTLSQSASPSKLTVSLCLWVPSWVESFYGSPHSASPLGCFYFPLFCNNVIDTIQGSPLYLKLNISSYSSLNLKGGVWFPLCTSSLWPPGVSTALFVSCEYTV